MNKVTIDILPLARPNGLIFHKNENEIYMICSFIDHSGKQKVNLTTGEISHLVSSDLVDANIIGTKATIAITQHVDVIK